MRLVESRFGQLAPSWRAVHRGCSVPALQLPGAPQGSSRVVRPPRRARAGRGLWDRGLLQGAPRGGRRSGGPRFLTRDGRGGGEAAGFASRAPPDSGGRRRCDEPRPSRRALRRDYRRRSRGVQSAIDKRLARAGFTKQEHSWCTFGVFTAERLSPLYLWLSYRLGRFSRSSLGILGTNYNVRLTKS